MPRFAALDLGSNALRLRIVEAHGPGSDPNQLSLLPERDGWKEVLNLRAPVRLGAEVFVTGRLATASIGQACAALKEFRHAMDAARVDAYRAIATSAVREAENAATLVERARREAGIDLEVIEGVEEARLVQLAVAKKLPLANKRAVLLDVGGGSTEVTVFERGHASLSVSLPIGTVRLLETYLRGTEKIDPTREKLLEEGVERAFAEVLPRIGNARFDAIVGTGGSVDTLADLCPSKDTAISPRGIDIPAARELLGKMCGMTAAQRKDKFNLRPDRADTIVPATAIFLRAAHLFGRSNIVAPGVGLKEGLLEELVAKFFHVWDTAGADASVLAACTQLGQRYHFDEPHGKLVSDFAAKLFDATKSVHGLSDRDRLLLRAAGLLHDVGDFVRYDGHHKHTYYLILHSDIMGLSSDERTIVANVARYHRKSHPDPSHPNFRDLDKDARSRVRGLSALLRIADALDREHQGKVDHLDCDLDSGKKKLVLKPHSKADLALEEWTVRAKSDLLREVLDLDVAFARA